jgi:hypothetical protein
VGGGGQGAADLPLDGLAGHVQDDGAARLLVEGQQVDARYGLAGHQPQAGQAQLLRERGPGAADEREQLVALGAVLRDEAAGLRGDQRPGGLVDA